ncbi:unnamed protein product [Adineta steineri]|uniref:HAT C-terminal dimerisation domain-containing protein n=2 Tax=Adineta steineri TaxID=433720 RepID=A0A815L5M7_9BILA|nr:unnamed protein product [Adineta steineri]
MKQCSIDQNNSFSEYIKQEMIMFDVDIESNNVSDDSARKTSNKTNQTLRIMEQYYEDESEQDDLPTTTAAIHQAKIDNYLKFRIDKSNTPCSSTSSSSIEEYNPLQFWKYNHTLYPRLAKIAKHVFAVPASSGGVERHFSLAGNIITKKRSRLSSDPVNDIIFQHSFNKYNQKNIENT